MLVGITSGATTVWKPLSGTSSCTGWGSGLGRPRSASPDGVADPARPLASKLEPNPNPGSRGTPLKCRRAVLQTGCELAGRAFPLPAGARNDLYRAELEVPGLPHDGV